MSEYIHALKLKMTEEEARKAALKKGDWLWNLVFWKLPLTELKLMYIEYEIIELKTMSTPSLISKLRGKPHQPVQKRMEVLVNGTSGSVALVTDKNLEFEDIKVTDYVEIQDAAFDTEEAIKRAKILAHKITHRAMGGMHEAEVVKFTPIYRPFWVAFYGEMEPGKKVRYITIPADGGQTHRAR